MSLEGYKALRVKAEKSVIYWQEIGLSEFLTSLREQMKRKRIRPVDLATRMNVSRAYISRVLNGEDNLTFATMVRLAMAVGGTVHVHVADRNAVTTWRDQDYSTRDSEAPVNFGDPEEAVNATFHRDRLDRHARY